MFCCNNCLLPSKYKCCLASCEINYCDFCARSCLINEYCINCFNSITDVIYFCIDANNVNGLYSLLECFEISDYYIRKFFDYSLLTSSKDVILYFIDFLSDDDICTSFINYGSLNENRDIVKILIERILTIYYGIDVLLLIYEITQDLEIKEYIDFRINKY